MGFTPCKAELPLRGMELQEKEAQKDYIIQEKRCVRLKVTKIIGQRKAFHRQKIPGSSCARKEIVHTDILVTSGNGDRKIMQSTCWGCQIYQQPPRVKFNELKKNKYVHGKTKLHAHFDWTINISEWFIIMELELKFFEKFIIAL